MKKYFFISIISAAVIIFSSCSQVIEAGGEPEDTTSESAETIPTITEAAVPETMSEVTAVPETAPETTAKTTSEATAEQAEIPEETAYPPYNSGVIDNEWAMFLVNQTHPIDDSFSVELQQCVGEYKMDKRCVPYMKAMFAAAKKDGINLNMISTYRTVERQKYLFQNDIDKYMNQGMTYEEAYAKTKMAVAVPYESEHHTGLAADILSDEYWRLDEGFEKTRAYEWLKENSWRYGFILRYPNGTTEITGIIYEPWHYRFVGLYHAKAIYDSGLTMEEYVAGLEG